jgi:hypothetical protein
MGGGWVSGRPAAAGLAGAEGAAPHSAGTPGPLGLATAVAATSHCQGAALGGQQSGPGTTGRARGYWGLMAHAAAAARVEAR